MSTDRKDESLQSSCLHLRSSQASEADMNTSAIVNVDQSSSLKTVDSLLSPIMHSLTPSWILALRPTAEDGLRVVESPLTECSSVEGKRAVSVESCLVLALVNRVTLLPPSN